jgi:hypothetical protein
MHDWKLTALVMAPLGKLYPSDFRAKILYEFLISFFTAPQPDC